MTTLSPKPTSIPLTPPTLPLNDANMDALPLELQQRICSLLTPKELKPLRLTSRIFAAAAGRYFINRFILFNCPESVAALDGITGHEVFSNNITTLVCDISYLEVSPDYRGYGADIPQPEWDEYRPKSLTLDDTKSYGSLTKEVMQRADDRYQSAYKYWEAKKRDNQVLQDRYETLMRNQKSDDHHLEVVATVGKALKECPRLRNLILSNRHSFVTRRRRHNVLGIEVRDTNTICGWSKFLIQALGDLSQLSSLTLVNTGIMRNIEKGSSLSLPNLKHLRVHQPRSHLLSQSGLTDWALGEAKSLETLSLLLPAHDITKVVKSLRSDCLRVCLLDFSAVAGLALVDFLLHHAASLQRLGLCRGSTDIGWAPVLSSIAGKFLALQRVQFDNLEDMSTVHSITLESAREAEHFVAFGGTTPVLQYHDRRTLYSHFHRGTYTDGPKQSELPSGLWQDYESIANEEWDASEWEDGQEMDEHG